LQLAASRWAFDQGAEKNDHTFIKLGSSLANDSRQNLLAAYELAVREAKARQCGSRSWSGMSKAAASCSRALVEAPTREGLELRRPDGKRVRIEVLAASRGGRAVRGRTLVFAGMDECAFFYDESTGVVNDADIYRTVLQRVVPGGAVWLVSTPWLAETGLLEQSIAKNLGTHETALAVVAPTRALNPTWDPTGEIERDMRDQDPTAAAREIDGIPLAAGRRGVLRARDVEGVRRRVAHAAARDAAPRDGDRRRGLRLQERLERARHRAPGPRLHPSGRLARGAPGWGRAAEAVGGRRHLRRAFEGARGSDRARDGGAMTIGPVPKRPPCTRPRRPPAVPRLRLDAR
jgi:hypothetical protein